MTNMLEWTSWSRHRKLYGFNKYVKNYEPRTVAAEVWQGVCVRARTSLYRIHIQYVSMCRGPGVIVCVSNGVCRCFALCMCVCIGLNVCFVGEPQSPQRPIEWNGLSHTYQPEATGYLPLINLMWLPYASPVT